MVQLAAVVEKPRKCRSCGKKKDTGAYLEIEGVIVIVTEPPKGGSIFIHRGVFCDMNCFQKYVRKMYDEGIRGKEGKIGARG